MEAASDALADQVFASILETARNEGVDSRALLDKLQDRLQNELSSQEEPEKKKLKMEVMDKKETDEQQEQQQSTLPEIAMGIFQLHGLKYLPKNVLVPTFALLSSDCQQRAMRELAIRCKEKHPSLFAAANPDKNVPALISWWQWRQFELDEATSRGLSNDAKSAASARISDVYGDIDVLLEVTKGDSIIWHGVSPLLEENDSVYSKFLLPHWTFDAPLPENNDTFSEDDTDFPGMHRFFFWGGRGDCSLQQKTLVKALYGAHSPHLVQTMPPIHVRIVLHQRSTGRMVTIISQSEPNQIIGEDYLNEIGSYSAIYHNDDILCLRDNRLFASAEFDFFCPCHINDGTKRIHFSTYNTEKMPDAQPSDHFHLKFTFEICDDTPSDNLTELILASMRDWFKGDSGFIEH